MGNYGFFNHLPVILKHKNLNLKSKFHEKNLFIISHHINYG